MRLKNCLQEDRNNEQSIKYDLKKVKSSNIMMQLRNNYLKSVITINLLSKLKINSRDIHKFIIYHCQEFVQAPVVMTGKYN